MEPIARHNRRPLFASSLAYAGAALALTFGIAACVPAPDSTPAPTPTPTPVSRAPAPVPAPAPTYDNWMDAPQTRGDWSYRTLGADTLAYFGSASNPQTAFAITCRRAERTIEFGRPGRTANQITIRTETASRSLNAGSGEIASPPSTVANVAARDPLLDAMALTKGRFAVETPGYPTLYLPAWAEVTRVIEDCR
ncbi:hypothetical protein [Erythrobacter sp. A6_0]|uniref:hypothetical protein n=1 Tax=Erythrobacter sp. A6_0 TaxID=2821089 RepID=UPI001ADD5285|nr:hypothetical protein [Erythrobacter sp. A6_0]MBO9510865.1 hypothetical protein [Erythrobacter sp. A6_0]